MQINAKELSALIKRVYINGQEKGVLGMLLMSSRDGKLVLSSTNLDIKNELVTDIDFSETYAIGKQTIDVINSIGDQVVKFTAIDDTLTLEFSGSKYRTALAEIEDIESIVKIEPIENKVSVNSNDLLEIIKKTRMYVAVDDTRYVFNGLYISENTIAATDGRRMLRYKTNINLGSSCIVPFSSIQYIIGIMENSDIIEIGIQDNNIQVSDGKFTMQSKLIDGTFPDIETVIPKDAPHKFTIDKEIFINQLNIALKIAEPPSKQVIFIGDGHEVYMSCNNDNFHTKVCDSTSVFKVAFKGDYIRDVLVVSSEKYIPIHFASDNSATSFSGNDSIANVIMPMKM